jgi:regulator of sigma E protease
MNILITIAAFVVAVGLLVTVHELGHYWVARLCNVMILRFSVGFGRPLFLRRVGRDRTEWVIAAIPLGGFVKMLDERDPDGAVDAAQLHRAFNRQNVWKRMVIVLAGPVANFVLAAVLYWALFVHGMPGVKPYLAAPAADSVAAAAGFRNSDLIRKVGDKEIATWQDLRWALLKEAVGKGSVSIEAEDAAGRLFVRQLGLDGLTKEDLEKDFMAKLGLVPYRPVIAPVIEKVVPDKAAARAGLQAGDRIVQAAGREMHTWEDLVEVISASPGREIELLLRRGEREVRVAVTPAEETDAEGKRVGRIGISPRIDTRETERLFTVVRHGPVDAAGKALEKTWDMSIFSLKMLGKMIIGDISWKNLSGPVTIADYAGQSAKLGVAAYLGFLALVSISLGVLNLLPIPVLDGGQLVYYGVEILKGSPVSERVMEVGQQIGLALLLGLTAFAFYNDIHRLITG